MWRIPRGQRVVAACSLLIIIGGNNPVLSGREAKHINTHRGLHYGSYTHSTIFDPILLSQIIFGTPRENSRHDAQSGFDRRRFRSPSVKRSASRYSPDTRSSDAFPSNSEYQTCLIFHWVADRASYSVNWIATLSREGMYTSQWERMIFCSQTLVVCLSVCLSVCVSVCNP